MRVTILPIFHMTDSTTMLKNCDMEYPLSDCDIRDVRFYSINAISPYYDGNDNDKEYTVVYANGEEYVCSLPVRKAITKIEQNETTLVQA